MILRTTGKDRSFSATVLHLFRADGIWPGGRKDWKKPWRPALISLASDPTSIRAISANLQNKAVATIHSLGRSELELPSTFGYVHRIQQIDEQRAILTAYLANLWGLKAPTGADPDQITCVLSPAKARLDMEGASTAKMVGTLTAQQAMAYELVADGSASLDRISPENWALLMSYAPLWVAHLDKRLQTPIIHEPRFYQLLLAAFVAYRLTGLASDHGKSESGYYVNPGYYSDTEWYTFDPRYGMARPLVTSTKTDKAQELIAEVTAAWHDSQQKLKQDTTHSTADSSD